MKHKLKEDLCHEALYVYVVNKVFIIEIVGVSRCFDGKCTSLVKFGRTLLRRRQRWRALRVVHSGMSLYWRSAAESQLMTDMLQALLS